ncbi:hypothetical protein LTR37_012825 [Vermiconidia calcicola]|uniref:Uncharacterized protein n=1 Tax=Vermiconidia calcicola TaxID=1690605 RepID=A0ACC3MZD0_9PEZI|nr:hypothetical protein LTR37_012825 [Vermiconidia calcicola]
MPTKTAYITGGASGIGQAVTEMLAGKGIKVVIADQNFEGAEKLVDSLKSAGHDASCLQCNVNDWESQLTAFEHAIDILGGRIDYVFPIAGIGERKAIQNDPKATKFEKPDLTVIDVDLNGVLYTAFLAVQQMRRQGKDEGGFRGKSECLDASLVARADCDEVAVTASVCGFYCVPTVPVYTAAKHGVVGFVRSYGKYLPEEGISMNAVCPNVVRTKISTDQFYDKVEADKLLTPMQGVVDAFEKCVDSDISGECLEIDPTGGVTPKAPAPHLNDETTRILDMIGQRSHRLHEPVQ